MKPIESNQISSQKSLSRLWHLLPTMLLLFGSLFLTTEPTKAAQAVCQIGGSGQTHAQFSSALGDTSCSTIQFNSQGNVLGGWTINRSLTIVGAVQSGDFTNFVGQSGRVFTISADNISVNLQDITIQSGDATQEASEQHGGGIYNPYLNTSLTLKDVTMTLNKASLGGAIYSAGKLTIEDSSFSSNSATTDGGAIWLNVNNAAIQSEIKNTTFSQNSAVKHGGAIDMQAGLTVIGSTFSDNSADAGGAIYTVWDPPLRLQQSIFERNKVTNSGGAVFSNGTSVKANGVLFDSNTADFKGGAVFQLSGGVPAYDNSIFTNNSALAGGAGAFHTTLALVDKSVFYNNTSTAEGSAVEILDSSAFFAQTTISGNNGLGALVLHAYDRNYIELNLDYVTVADNGARGVYLLDSTRNQDSRVTVELDSTIIANHTVNCWNQTNAGVIDASDGYNISTDSSCGTESGTGNRVVADVGLKPLADNGGNTMTRALNSTSPAFNQIPSGTNRCGAAYDEDQRGFPRPALGLCDIGAYEMDCSSVPTVASDTETLNFALHCFNEVGVGDHTINLTQGITLTEQTVLVNNANATLHINGDGHIIDGADSYRHFYVINSNVTMTNVVLQNGKQNEGGSIRVGLTSTLILRDSLIQNNSGNLGGALKNDGDAQIINTVLRDNEVSTAGGAIFNSLNAKVELINSTLATNKATQSGGGFFSNGWVIINDSTLQGNEAQYGGGIYGVLSRFDIANSTLSGNIASAAGGAIYNRIETMFLSHVTVTNNTAPEGAGISSSTEAETVTILEHSIIANNNNGADLALQSGGTNTFQSNGYNVIGSVGSGVVLGGMDDVTGVADAGLDSLTNNGCATKQGPTATAACGQTHFLALTSLAVDRAVGSTETADQRGIGRPIANAADSGALERGCPSLPIGIGNTQILNFAIGCFNSLPAGNWSLFLTQDFTLSAPTAPINNLNNATLNIAGSGKTIDGADSYRHFTVSRGTLTLADLTLRNGASNEGGAINVASGATAKIERVTLQDNGSDFGGAINNNGVLTIASSTLVGNSATVSGGAIFNRHKAEVSNSTFSANSAQAGGAIVQLNALDVYNSTFVGNSGSNGSTFYGSRSPWVYNSIIADGVGGSNCGGSTSFILSNNLSSDHSCGGAQFSDSILVGPLQDNGGSTWTHGLQAASSALNTGHSVTCSSAPVNNVDQRGVARPHGGACDVGAVEWQTAVSPDLTINSSEKLAWTPPQASCINNLWRSTTPYSDYGWQTDDPSSFDVAASLTDPIINYFYYLAVDCLEGSAESPKMGEFTFEIVPGG
ncbi:MAG: choice-of-anchor Q domain-containing protein [Chloroflexota bacterium]